MVSDDSTLSCLVPWARSTTRVGVGVKDASHPMRIGGRRETEEARSKALLKTSSHAFPLMTTHTSGSKNPRSIVSGWEKAPNTWATVETLQFQALTGDTTWTEKTVDFLRIIALRMKDCPRTSTPMGDTLLGVHLLIQDPSLASFLTFSHICSQQSWLLRPRQFLWAKLHQFTYSWRIWTSQLLEGYFKESQ